MSAPKKQDRASSVKARMGALTGLQSFTGGRDTSHPLGGEFGFSNAKDFFQIDPKKIELEGPYVRAWFEDDEFGAFCEAVKQNGDIGQPIGIRTVGQGMDVRYVLVYGMRRWKAALAAGLDRIPARNYGEMPEDEALSLQLVENEARADPHPVDTAHGFYLNVEQGKSQADIVRATGRNSGYVSFMRKVGEAIAALSDEERQRLYTSPRITVRAFQEVANVDGLAERKAALLKLATQEDSTVAQAVQGRLQREKSAFYAHDTRNSRSFRVQIRDDDLRADPVGFTQSLLQNLAEEQERLANRLRALEAKHRKTGRQAPKKPADPDALADAARRVDEAVAQMRRLLEAGEDR